MEAPVASLPAEEAAAAVLQEYWDLGSEQTPLPVDPIHIARSQGIQVFTAALEEGVSGLLIRRAGDEPRIYLNESESRTRQRFTTAHELGHFAQRAGSHAVLAFVDRRDQLAGRGTDPDEVYANRFAAALLMPSEAARRLRDYLDVSTMAKQFGVSPEAMTNRLKNLRVT